MIADDEARLDELAAVLDELDRREARRWITVAAFGLALVATSTLLHHWTAAGPVGPLGRMGLTLGVWIGLVPAAAVLVPALVRPDGVPKEAPWTVLVGAVVIGIAVAGPLSADHLGPAPWLALCGALIAGTAALTHLVVRRFGAERAGSQEGAPIGVPSGPSGPAPKAPRAGLPERPDVSTS